MDGTTPPGTGTRTLVVGASSGIGRALATTLVERGGRVAAAARRLDRLQGIDGALPVRCDAADPAQVDEAVDTAAAALGGLDAVIYAAGQGQVRSLVETSVEDWLSVYRTNVFGPAMAARRALPYLLDPGSQGRILFLTSDSAYLPYPGMLAYCSSKAALGSLAAGLASETGLRVSEIVVGPTGGTEVANDFDPDAFATWGRRWFEDGFVRFELVDPGHVVGVIMATLGADRPARQVWATGPEAHQSRDEVQAIAEERGLA